MATKAAASLERKRRTGRILSCCLQNSAPPWMTPLEQERKTLTACASGAPDTLARQDWAGAAQYLDLINLMTYHLCGCWAGVSGHASSAAQAKIAVQCILAQGVASGKRSASVRHFTARPCACGKNLCLYRQRSALPSSRSGRRGIRLRRRIYWNFCRRPAGTAPMTRGQAARILSTTGRIKHSTAGFYRLEDRHAHSGRSSDLIRNADLAGIIVWEASLDTKNHSFAAQLRDTLLR